VDGRRHRQTECSGQFGHSDELAQSRRQGRRRPTPRLRSLGHRTVRHSEEQAVEKENYRKDDLEYPRQRVHIRPSMNGIIIDWFMEMLNY
jgi:hypothetical protein